MKKNILLIAFLVAAIPVFSQNAFEGIWEGKINSGIDLRVIFLLEKDAGNGFIATMDLPDNGIKGIISKDVVVDKDSLVINIKEFHGTYSGKLIDQNTIAGNWKQGSTVALQLYKIEKRQKLYRPQTPMPPFSYKSENVLYSNENNSIRYGATITMPFGEGPFPAVVLITGSGQQNRDEEIAEHKPFAVIADFLTRNGFAVLRVDDRGMGQTTGDVFSATTLDFANDINTALNYLLSRNEIDKGRLGLIGHSEGGMIAPMLASKRKDISAIVLLAAPGRNNMDLLIEQNEAIQKANGIPETYVKEYIDLYSSLLLLIRNTTDMKITRNAITDTVDSWLKKTSKDIIIATTGINDDQKRIRYIDGMVAVSGSPWFQYFLRYNPQDYLEKLRCNVFALNGKKDIQIISKSNLSGIGEALKRSEAKHYKIKEYEELNHLFQKCKACTINEYGVLEETFSVEALNDISIWLKEFL